MGDPFADAVRGWTWGYDRGRQLTKAVHTASVVLDRAYAFDVIGNRTRATEGSATPGYTPRRRSVGARRAPNGLPDGRASVILAR